MRSDAGDEAALVGRIVPQAEAGGEQQLATLEPGGRIDQLGGVRPADPPAIADPGRSGDQFSGQIGMREQVLQGDRHVRLSGRRATVGRPPALSVLHMASPQTERLAVTSRAEEAQGL